MYVLIEKSGLSLRIWYTGFLASFCRPMLPNVVAAACLGDGVSPQPEGAQGQVMLVGDGALPLRGSHDGCLKMLRNL